MFTSTNLRLNYPRTNTRYDERTLAHHGVTFYHVDDDPHFYQEYDASILYRDGNWQVYGDNTPTKCFQSLDACLHYILGGVFYQRKWYEHHGTTIEI
jgi:hypothetical protein